MCPSHRCLQPKFTTVRIMLQKVGSLKHYVQTKSLSLAHQVDEEYDTVSPLFFQYTRAPLQFTKLVRLSRCQTTDNERQAHPNPELVSFTAEQQTSSTHLSPEKWFHRLKCLTGIHNCESIDTKWYYSQYMISAEIRFWSLSSHVNLN